MPEEIHDEPFQRRLLGVLFDVSLLDFEMRIGAVRLRDQGKRHWLRWYGRAVLYSKGYLVAMACEIHVTV
jgi:hypothetical protein